MRFHAQIKKGAKSALRGNWGRVTAIFFIFIGFWLLISSAETLVYLLCGFDPYMDPSMTPENFLDNVLAYTPAQILITAGACLVWLLVFMPLFGGCVRWFHALTGGEAPELKTLFGCFASFRRWRRCVAAALQVLVRALIWLAAFISLPVLVSLFFRYFPIPQASPLARFADFGTISAWVLTTLAVFFYLVFLQRYSLTFHYLAEDEKLTARKAVKESIRATDGRCGELFSLRLSFFWWALLSVLVLPMMYTVPYYCASISIYARYLMEYQRRADEEPPAPPSEWMEKPADPAGELPAAEDKTQEYPVSEVRSHLEEEKAL